MKLQCFFQVCKCFLFGFALTCYVDLKALRDIRISLSPDRCGEWPLHSLIVSQGSPGFWTGAVAVSPRQRTEYRPSPHPMRIQHYHPN